MLKVFSTNERGGGTNTGSRKAANPVGTWIRVPAEGIGIARVCAETVEDAIKAGRLVPLLEAFNPGDGEEIHAVFLGGTHTPARVRCFVDYLVERFK